MKTNKIVGLSLSILLAGSFVGCSTNAKEVKTLKEQVAKLEQQLNESEKEAVSECKICGHSSTCLDNKCINQDKEEKCLNCGEIDLIKNMTYKKEHSLPEEDSIEYRHRFCTAKETTESKKNSAKEKSSNKEDIFVCPVCGGKNTCPKDSECLNPPKDPNYVCDICGNKGTCTETGCFNYIASQEYYCYCKSCNKGLYDNEDYVLEDDNFCKDCYNVILKDMENGYCQNCARPLDSDGLCTSCDYVPPYGWCDNPDCGMPLPKSKHCTYCGDYYSTTTDTLYCTDCGIVISADQYYNSNGWCEDCRYR